MKFKKHDIGKSRLDLLPARAIELVGYVLALGAEKYGPHNWRLCKDPGRYTAAMLRHAMRDMAGEELDPESQIFHLAHAACSAMFALEIKLMNPKAKKPKKSRAKRIRRQRRA